MLIRPTDALIRLDRSLWQGRDINDWLSRHGVEPTASIVDMMLMSGGMLAPATTIYDHTGADQSYAVPWGVFKVGLKLWAAGGASEATATMSGADWGGAGGFVAGVLAVTPGEVLDIVVGQAGIPDSTSPTYGGGGAAGGVGTAYRGGSGGGRSAARRAGVDIVTAGGGGGGGNMTNGAVGGGVGGGVVGGDAPFGGGHGGTQSAGGAGAGDDATAGSQYQGGRGSTGGGSTGTSGGGGGGKFGGGGGNGQGGGGGSSDATNLTGTVTNLQGSGWSPPNTADGDYAGTIARGGRGVENPPGPGRVVITTIP